MVAACYYYCYYWAFLEWSGKEKDEEEVVMVAETRDAIVALSSNPIEPETSVSTLIHTSSHSPFPYRPVDHHAPVPSLRGIRDTVFSHAAYLCYVITKCRPWHHHHHHRLSTGTCSSQVQYCTSQVGPPLVPNSHHLGVCSSPPPTSVMMRSGLCSSVPNARVC